MSPEQFAAWKIDALRKNLTAAQQLEQDTQTQDLGGYTRVLTRPKYGSAPFTVAPGSEAQKTMTPAQANPAGKLVQDEQGNYVLIDTRGRGAVPVTTGGGGIPAGRGGADTVYGNGQYGAPSTPLSSMTIGQVQDYQRNSLIPATRGKVGAGPDKGTGAVGTYQITYGTLKAYAPKVLGANWRNTPFTADAQERIARAIYEDVKGGNLKDTWQGLPANKPGAYSNVPWEQVRGQIAAVESGGGGAPVKGPVKSDTPTVPEQAASYNINRVLQAAAEIQRVTKDNPAANAPGAVEATVGSLPLISQGINFARSSDRQIVAAAQRDLLDGLLYLATGAAYNKEQLQGQMESYIPSYSDKPATVKSKRDRLTGLIATAKSRAGRAWTPQMDAALKSLIGSGGGKPPRSGGTPAKPAAAKRTAGGASVSDW
jgi:hypothetical protein